MDPQRYDLVASIFAEVRPLPPEPRAAALDRLCAGDPELRGEVEMYLRHDAGDGPSLLSTPVVADPALIHRLLGADEEEFPPGSRISAFTVVRRLGEGGFGAVYLAEQSSPRRQVAVKVIKPGMDSKAVVARFEQERQALAVMDHPNVARVIDGGETQRGRPYFVMEYVEGESITEYCDRRSLSVADRLKLFQSVCEAVQHAHLKGIIHRDLKPSNILVTEKDGRACPKVIDFGVAKAINQLLTDKTIFTWTGQIIGTPEYMSPEQADIGRMDIDTRTDVYSLGAVLYELLTGQVPFDTHRLRTVGYAEIQRILREEEPARPSARLSSLGPAAAPIAERRGTRAAELAALLNRELEWIPLRAIRKDRDQRYATPMDLSRDIERYLGGEALEAGPESTIYQIKKAVHRNQYLLGAVAAVVVSLLVGLVTTLWKAHEAKVSETKSRELAGSNATLARDSEERRQVAEREKESAQRARRRVALIIQLVANAFQSGDPSSAGGRQDITISEAMQRAIQTMESGLLTDEPEMEADLQTVIGSVLQNNGHAEEALPLFERALKTRRRLYLKDHHTISTSLNNLAAVLLELGRTNEAEPLLREALAMDRRLSPGDHPDIASSFSNLAGTVLTRGDAAEALSMFREALEMYRRIYAGDHADIASAMNNVGFALGNLSRFIEAEPVLQQVLEMYQRLHAGDHPDVARSLNNLAFVRQQLGRLAEAEPLYKSALEMRQRLYRGDHPDVAESLSNMGYIWEHLNRPAEAEPMYEHALDMYQRLYPGDHPRVAVCISNLADVRVALERFGSAEPLYRGALEMRQRLIATDHPDVALSLSSLAWCQFRLGEFDDAERSARLAAEMYARLFPNGHSDRGIALSVQACIAHARKREAEAQMLIGEAERMILLFEGPEGQDLRRITEAKNLMQDH